MLDYCRETVAQKIAAVCDKITIIQSSPPINIPSRRPHSTVYSFGTVTREKATKPYSDANHTISQDPVAISFSPSCSILCLHTNIFNLSVSTGIFHSALKPLLDPTSLNNLRPICLLLFTSKILECLIYNCLSCYFTDNNLFGPF